MKYLKTTLSQDLEQVRIIPLADVHAGNPHFNERAFRAFVRQIADDPNTYTLLNGDLCEYVTRDSKGDVYRQTMSPQEQVKYLAAELAPIRDKILCLNSGNHEARAANADYSPMAHLAEKLGLEDKFSDDGTLLVLRFGRFRGQADKYAVYTIYATHGWGNGRRSGGKLNAMQELAWAVDANCYMVSHGHDLISGVRDQIVPDMFNDVLRREPKAFVMCGSFLEYGDYAAKRGYAPNAIAMPSVTFEGRVKQITVHLPSAI